MNRPILKVDGNSLSLGKIDLFLKENPIVSITEDAQHKVNKARDLVEKWIKEDQVIYGVTTGFGEFANVKISKADLEQLQENLILSHAVGTGDYLPPFIVKIMMLLRVNALAKGYSGIRLSTINLLIEMMNNNIIPVVPSQGSVGSSGDLVQLSHLVLAMIGKGRVQIIENVLDQDAAKGEILPSAKALKQFNLTPVKLCAKDGTRPYKWHSDDDFFCSLQLC